MEWRAVTIGSSGPDQGVGRPCSSPSFSMNDSFGNFGSGRVMGDDLLSTRISTHRPRQSVSGGVEGLARTECNAHTYFGMWCLVLYTAGLGLGLGLGVPFSQRHHFSKRRWGQSK